LESTPKSNNIIVEYKAISEELTPINLANHIYFNLCPGKKIYEHFVQINADSYLDFNPSDITVTGKINKVDGTKYDLRSFTLLSDRIKENQVWPDDGFDNYFITNSKCSEGENGSRLVAS
jgi:aldose 1-epimerase